MLLGASRAQRSPFFRPRASEEVAGLLGDREQFAAGDGVDFFAVNFLEHRFGGGFLQLGEDIFEKCHAARTPLCFSSSFTQAGAERGKIIFPAEDAFAHGELRIAARDLLFEIGAHARHQLQIAGDGAFHGVGNFFGFGIESAEGCDDFVGEVGFVDAHEEMFVAAFAQEIADALVHGDSGGGNAGGHGGDDGVIARGEQAIAGAQDADELVHVELIGAEDRRAA